MKFKDLVLLVERNENVVVVKNYWDEAETKLKSEYWGKDNRPHRLDGPAFQSWYKNGKKSHELWKKDGKPHRLDGPAKIEWDENGQKLTEIWYKDGKPHRLDGPAAQKWNSYGKVGEIWYKDGKLHRLDGPAVQKWNIFNTNQLNEEKYYIDGKEVPKSVIDAYNSYDKEDRQKMDNLLLPDLD